MSAQRRSGGRDPSAPVFTVFTPTRDRAASLPRVFTSLTAQTFDDFEWLVVDDGSIDETPALLDQWRHEAPFRVRVIRKRSPAGKLEAMRTALEAAHGRFFLTLDSDDGCVPDALERLNAVWESIPIADRSRFSAVTGLCVDDAGRVVGTPFPHDPTDSNSLEIRFRHGVRGEKWGFQRTDVLRLAMADVPQPAGFVPEGYIWDAIARRYQTRYINAPLRIYHRDQADRLSSPADLATIATGGLIAYGALLNEDIGWLRFAPLHFGRQAVYFVRLAFHAKCSLRWQWRALRPRARALWLAALPAGAGLYVMDVVGLRAAVRKLLRRR